MHDYKLLQRKRWLVKKCMVETLQLPPLIFLDLTGDTVRIRDLTHRTVVDIIFRRIGVSCRACDIDNCKHIKYALTVPDVQKAVWKRIKEGWDLPEPHEFPLWVV
jgi:hypothetical protein